MASQSEQNSNRDTRSDKKEPCMDLKKEGILELPRYVRWDKGEEKFVIDRHPQLVREVETGLRKKWSISCTKRKIPIIEKYKDAINRLEMLDKQYYTDEDKEFVLNKAKLKMQYQLMCQCLGEVTNTH